ncbi:hypothetical protein AVEN_46799-1 [Araneus ventricosus]|uniref:Uncharacterized protein n=1 Tax=Araneus ventricosus TaxID=182803 RepID=A0A4Y1ZTC5_ARAVE|nr:hypothetical protein AVEN_46799-1 [Araneus ventricosus]
MDETQAGCNYKTGNRFPLPSIHEFHDNVVSFHSPSIKVLYSQVRSERTGRRNDLGTVRRFRESIKERDKIKTIKPERLESTLGILQGSNVILFAINFYGLKWL